MKKMIAMLAGAVLLLAACNKDKKNDDVTKENLVGTYKLASMVSQLGNEPVVDEMAGMEPCEKDDLIKLNTDMTCNAVDAGSVCNPNGSENGTWSLPSSTQIVILGETSTIKSFSGKTLVLEAVVGSGNQASRMTVTMAKQ